MRTLVFAGLLLGVAGAAPAAVLDDPAKLEPLITAAAASRGNIAA